MKITGLSLFKWENLHNWWLTKYFFAPLYIYMLLCYFYLIFILLHCPLSGPDLIYISLLIIPCIIYYVTNKETLILNLEMDRWDLRT